MNVLFVKISGPERVLETLAGPNHDLLLRSKAMAESQPILAHAAPQSETPRYQAERKAWSAMKQRCLNPKCKTFAYYGGRGITVCNRWLESFDNFFADMGPRPSRWHSIERKDNDGSYCKENCAWETKSAQARNTRARTRYEFNGKSQLLSEWSEEVGIPRAILSNRIYEGWTIEKALTTPVGIGRAKPTQCPNGHQYDESNIRINSKGAMICRACIRIRQRERRRLLDLAQKELTP